LLSLPAWTAGPVNYKVFATNEQQLTPPRMSVSISRRRFAWLAGAGLAGALVPVRPSRAQDGSAARFIAEADRMKQAAVARGDQAYGAVVVRDGAIVGYGPSRVVQDGNPDAHAERVALLDAQRRLGTNDLSGAVIYSTSRPCPVCETALARANIARMVHGPAATDAGKPQRY
jgi:tRNA(adenine34) deaminase